MPAFFLFQAIGALVAWAAIGVLYPNPREAGDRDR
jgi:hypothetical protein